MKHCQNSIALTAILLAAVACSPAAGQPYNDIRKFPAADYCAEGSGADALTEQSATSGTEGEYTQADLMLAEVAQQIAKSAKTAEECEKIFLAGSAQFEDLIERKRQSFSELGSSRLSRDPELRSIQEQITLLWRQDQSARGIYVALQTADRSGQAYWAERLSAAHAARMDEISYRYLSKVLEDFDWIDRKRFGRTVSDQAWLLVQHADDYPEFQTMALGRMEKYLASGGVNRGNYAYLWDRVAVNTGKKQRYGTQPDWNCQNGKMKLRPLEDPKQVNRLRKKMGLNTVEKGLKDMNRQTCH